MNLKLKPKLQLFVPMSEEEIVLHLECIKSEKRIISLICLTFITLFYLSAGLWTLLLIPIPLFFYWQSCKLQKRMDSLNEEIDKHDPEILYPDMKLFHIVAGPNVNIKTKSV